MTRFKKESRIRNKKRRNLVLVTTVFVILLCLVLFINDKYSSKKYIANNTSNITNRNNDNLKNIIANSKDFLPIAMYKPDGHKIAYLTFDDGPSSDITPKILDILKDNNIKATFFVIGKNIPDNKDILLREQTDGHSIGNHTYSHNPDFLYKNPKNLVSDFRKNEILIKQFIPDYNSKIVRFPGGSKNRPKQFRTAVVAAGYRYFDWDCLTKDAEVVHIPLSEEDNNVKSTFKNQKKLIILMHDSTGKDTTVQYLPILINFLKANGYTFSAIS